MPLYSRRSNHSAVCASCRVGRTHSCCISTTNVLVSSAGVPGRFGENQSTPCYRFYPERTFRAKPVCSRHRLSAQRMDTATCDIPSQAGRSCMKRRSRLTNHSSGRLRNSVPISYVAAHLLRGLLSLAFLSFACSANPQSEQHGNVAYCPLESSTSRKLLVPPPNAAYLRKLAKRHHSQGFGPPQSQTNRPGATWDLTNEFWYEEDGGHVVLYCNTDDNHMYHWRFRVSGHRAKLVKHGVLECPHTRNLK